MLHEFHLNYKMLLKGQPMCVLAQGGSSVTPCKSCSPEKHVSGGTEGMCSPPVGLGSVLASHQPRGSPLLTQPVSSAVKRPSLAGLL